MKTSQSTIDISFDRHPAVKKYAEEIPVQLHDLLLPGDRSEFEEFTKRLKELRFILEERAYVMDLQDF